MFNDILRIYNINLQTKTLQTKPLQTKMTYILIINWQLTNKSCNVS